MEFESLDPAIRRTIRKLILACMIFFIITDWLFFIAYIMTGTLKGPVPYYLVWHVTVPIVIYILSFVIANVADKSKTLSDHTKNYIVAFAMFAVASALSIFHAYFPPVWCAPAIILMFTSCFHDSKMQKILLVCCYIVTVISMVFICVEGGDLAFYLENGFVVISMNTIVFIIAGVVQNYNAEMLRKTTDYFEQQKEYRRQLEYDNLTSVLTRPFFQAQANEMLRWARKDHPISIAIIDIDNFKHVNDTYGHDNGDVVLRELGRLMNRYVSKEVIAGRYGGEEFVFAFSSGNPKEAEETLNNLREDFSRAKYEFMNEQTTFSGGINTVYWVTDFEDAFVGADDALYVSKNNGKNQLTKYMRK